MSEEIKKTGFFAKTAQKIVAKKNQLQQELKDKKQTKVELEKNTIQFEIDDEEDEETPGAPEDLTPPSTSQSHDTSLTKSGKKKAFEVMSDSDEEEDESARAC